MADGIGPIRMDTTYNDIMRTVGQQTDVDVVDGARVLDSMPEVFIDDCHFNEEGHRRIGELIATHLVRQLGLAGRD
jgi:hypothetical protein